jgi:SAM-dependent methyltransferase
MEDGEKLKLREIKAKVLAMLEERQALTSAPQPTGSSDFNKASKYWTHFCAKFDYVFGMDEESFAKLRLHTYHLTGDNYQLYYFGNPNAWIPIKDIEEVTRGLPPSCVLNEPEGGIGHRYPDGRFLSGDVLRYQQVVTTLFRQGILRTLWDGRDHRPQVLEIGTGYGGLAHHLSRVLAEGARGSTYFMVDLPETLVFAASYLTLLNPEKKIYLYDQKDFDSRLSSGGLAAYDFVLLPNYKLEALNRESFDLCVNVASLQEMTDAQVETYLDFIRATCSGVFYSWNQDCQPMNKELSNLSDLLRVRFDLNEERRPSLGRRLVLLTRKQVKRAAVTLKLMNPPDQVYLPYREYTARPRRPGGGATKFVGAA